MENYTKYALKAENELTAALNGAEKLFVVACNKCFKEFESMTEPESETFVQLAEAQGKKITGAVNVDFLCNKIQSAKVLLDNIP